MRLSVCLEVFFQDLALADRTGRIKQAGYSAGEFWGHEGRDLAAVAAACREHDVEIVAMVGTGIDPGFNDPEAHDRLIGDLDTAIEAARVVGCPRLIVMGGNVRRRVTRSAQSAAIIRGHISSGVKVRYAYYASDNPMLSGQTLATGSMGKEGIRPTYMITKVILQKNMGNGK